MIFALFALATQAVYARVPQRRILIEKAPRYYIREPIPVEYEEVEDEYDDELDDEYADIEENEYYEYEPYEDNFVRVFTFPVLHRQQQRFIWSKTLSIDK